MKKLISAVLAATMALCLFCGTAFASYDQNTDYMAVMMNAALTGDYAKGNAAEASRNAKLTALGLDDKIAFDDLYLLAKVIYIEAGGCSWLSEEWKFCVGEVLMNRVASPEFPNTVRGVVYQRGQYASAGSSNWESLMPNMQSVQLALRLLRGERHMDSSVVFQANFTQGSGVYLQMYDKLLGSTYFCYSNNPSLY